MPSARTVMRQAGGISVAAGLAVAAGIAAGHASPTPPTPVPTTAAASPSSFTLQSSSPRATSATGPGITEAGVRITAQLDSSGGLEVVEQIRVAQPVGELALTAPTSPESIGDASKIDPQVTELQAQTPDGPQQIPAAVPGTLTLSAPATRISLRYRLNKAIVRSEPAPIGRVLGLLEPLAAPAPATTPVIVNLMGSEVLNLVCPQLPVAQRGCGSKTDGSWAAGPVPLERAVFVIQADLPSPGGS